MKFLLEELKAERAFGVFLVFLSRPSYINYNFYPEIWESLLLDRVLCVEEAFHIKHKCYLLLFEVIVSLSVF